MTIRTFQPGDEATQVAIYNEAAAALPRFKPATAVEVQRRQLAERKRARHVGFRVGIALPNHADLEAGWSQSLAPLPDAWREFPA